MLKPLPKDKMFASNDVRDVEQSHDEERHNGSKWQRDLRSSRP